jgi:hypothetical protein
MIARSLVGRPTMACKRQERCPHRANDSRNKCNILIQPLQGCDCFVSPQVFQRRWRPYDMIKRSLVGRPTMARMPIAVLSPRSWQTRFNPFRVVFPFTALSYSYWTLSASGKACPKKRYSPRTEVRGNTCNHHPIYFRGLKSPVY